MNKSWRAGFIPLALLLLSLTYFNRTESAFLWKLSIAATEYGHWFALLAGLLLMRAKTRGAVVALTVAFVLFAQPTAQLLIGIGRWSKELEIAFAMKEQPIRNQPPLWALWFGRQESKVETKTLTFTTHAGMPLQLDLYPAVDPGGATAPWVLVLHGGGWNSGDRRQLTELNHHLAHRGVSVASISYRLAPESKWPAQLEDVRDAVKFLKGQAAVLGLDPERYVVLGRSAGGQLAESISFQTPRDPGLRGCIAFYAPSDLAFAYRHAQEDDLLKSPTLIRDYLGGEPIKFAQQFQSASPLNSVSPNSPPTLLFHGPNDPLVWVRHSERLLARLEQHAVPSALVSIPWATHGFDYNLNGPGGLLSTYSIDRFLDFVFQQKQERASL